MGFLAYCAGSVAPIVVLLDKLTVVPLRDGNFLQAPNIDCFENLTHSKSDF
jgi:hypothetical protein